MKRCVSLLFLLFLTTLFVSPFTSAYQDIRYYTETTVDAFVNAVEPFLQAILGGNDWTSKYLFEKLLIYFILVALVFFSLKNIPAFRDSGSKVTGFISFLIPLIGVRYIEPAWIEAILLQYQILAIALAGILPFIIYFFFLHEGVGKENDVIRKVGWVFFIVIYFGLWTTAPSSSYADIYFWTMVASLILLFMDNTIHRALIMQDMKRAGRTQIALYIGDLRDKIRVIRGSGLPPNQIDSEVRGLENQIRKAIKQMGRIP
ncbi:hypothetical protein FJZ18_01500 [Candidatus Pacearchaeota archaeon]|nr:hypothetical protein [Candidatus Pacearchaeota archaeon]